MWRASVLTIFPEMFPGPLGLSLAGKALASGAWSLDVVDIRSFATDKHRTVDDTPAGGGPGMVMKADVLGRAIDAAATDARPRLLMSPRGTPLTQSRIEALTGGAGVVLVCGRFEGIDERVIAAIPCTTAFHRPLFASSKHNPLIRSSALSTSSRREACPSSHTSRSRTIS